MEKEFVPYEQALELKGLGFDKPCLIKDTEQGEDFAIYYEHENGRPTFSQAFKWFRDKYQIDSKVERDYSLQDLPKQYCYIIDDEDGFEESINFNSYEEAELACLKKLIEITKEYV